MTGDGPRAPGDDGARFRPEAVPARPAPPAPSCPACHHRHAHAPGCELTALPVREAATLGHEAALARVRGHADDDYPLPPPIPPGPGYGFPPPTATAACPACHHQHQHQPGCPLTTLPVRDAATLGHAAALAWVRGGGRQPAVPGTPAAPTAACPTCHHQHQHQPGCPLTTLPVRDAATLGHDAALAWVRGGGRRPAVPGTPAAPTAACPACHHQYRHQPGCPLDPLPVDEAALLGHDAALNRAHALRAPAATAPPPPADTCPACHHTRRHRPGCELAALPVPEAAVLGRRAALDLIRVRAASGPPDPPDPSAPGFFRRLLRRRRR
ncbi:hypothetical protein AB0G32_15095 [Streptomyces sp. NPDC023723]|uniref:hypothetical protein n=1 Tax=Streptomyces sp. NPDC023723 TaxID=3154323 RepID=UPI003401AEB7